MTEQDTTEEPDHVDGNSSDECRAGMKYDIEAGDRVRYNGDEYITHGIFGERVVLPREDEISYYAPPEDCEIVEPGAVDFDWARNTEDEV